MASIERVLNKTPIGDRADALTILGWTVVVSRDTYQIGDLCCYIPIDMKVDNTRECFKFLKDPVIKTVKICGVYSQGIVMPVPDGYNEGDDASEYYGVTKYEKIVEDESTGKFPKHIINVTDEPNFKSKPKWINSFKNERVYITQKMDGSSMTIIHTPDMTCVCSRKCIAPDESDMYKYATPILHRLSSYNIVIQGEFCGPKINKNRHRFTEFKFFVFTIKLDGQYLGWPAIKQICDDLGLETVPLIEIMDFAEHDIAYFQQYANSRSGEGIVIRPVVPKMMDYRMLSVKVLNQKYVD